MPKHKELNINRKHERCSPNKKNQSKVGVALGKYLSGGQVSTVEVEPVSYFDTKEYKEYADSVEKMILNICTSKGVCTLSDIREEGFEDHPKYPLLDIAFDAVQLDEWALRTTWRRKDFRMVVHYENLAMSEGTVIREAV